MYHLSRLFGFIELLLILILSNNATILYAQSTTPTYEEAAVLWQGFTHQWTYNHRINRLGSCVVNTDFEGAFPHSSTLKHMAATGLGGDIGQYATHYAYLALNKVKTQSGEVNIRFSGKEGDFHTAKQTVTIDAPLGMHDQEEYAVVLNGFDIISEQQADKLQLFRLSVGDATYIPATGKIRFDVTVALLVHCRSLECSRFNHKFNYSINAHYLVFAGQEQNISTTEQNTHTIYDWSKERELYTSPTQQHTVKGEGKRQYAAATLAFKSLSIHLDKEHWLLDWRSVIHPEKYDTLTGQYQYSLDLLFKQWDQTMKKESANPKKSKFAMKRNGWAMIDATILLLQFKDARIIHDYTKGVVKWQGSNEPANTVDALQQEELIFTQDMLNTQVKEQLFTKRKQKEQENEQLYEQYVAELEQARQLRKEEKRQEKEEKRQEKEGEKEEKRLEKEVKKQEKEQRRLGRKGSD